MQRKIVDYQAEQRDSTKKSLIFYDCTAAQMDCVSKMFLRQNMQLIDIYMASTILRES